MSTALALAYPALVAVLATGWITEHRRNHRTPTPAHAALDASIADRPAVTRLAADLHDAAARHGMSAETAETLAMMRAVPRINTHHAEETTR